MDQTKLIEHRQWLHRNAELSFVEHKTQDYICSVLSGLGIEHCRVAATGVLAVVGDRQKPAIVLRADIDALPIEEQSGVDFMSINQGVMHACGHDMHTAMLIGALADLQQNIPSDRVVVGLFQPGEEVNPGGASIVLSEGVLGQFDVKAVVGQHCSPELPVGVIGSRRAEMMASTDEVHITVKGKGGHAARPDELRNPVPAAVAILSELYKIAPSADIEHLLTFGRIIADGATNVIPDKVTVAGTFRTFDRQWRVDCKDLICQKSKQIADSYGVDVEVEFGQGYPSVINDGLLFDQAKQIIDRELGQYQFVETPKRLTAEDFGHYCAIYPSVFFRLGVGGVGELHSSKFCPDQMALSVGVRLLYTLATQLPL